MAEVSSLQLMGAALLGVALVVFAIARLRVHPFLGLTLASFVAGVGAERALADVLTSFLRGFGETAAHVGTLIALGAMFAELLARSGGAQVLVERLVSATTPRALPFALAAAGALVGLPVFFEVGLMLLLPILVSVARRTGRPLLEVSVPALAGLSAMHGLVPPHPGPLVGAQALSADLGLTVGLGVLVAVPAVVLAGPVLVRFLRVSPTPQTVPSGAEPPSASPPTFIVTLATLSVPMVLMTSKGAVELLPLTPSVRALLGFVGHPFVAMLLSVLIASHSFGFALGRSRRELAHDLERALPPTAAIFLVVAAGGGFKQTLVDSGIAAVISGLAHESTLSPLLFGWLSAVCIRLATGSATVATITASAVLAPMAVQLSAVERSLLVLAIGSGSLFLSHVNDAGFWLVKQSLGLSVGETLRSWSLLECVLSVAGLILVLLLGAWW